ncbi:Bromodomain-containing protein, partial [Pleomassaria siparia CBS 279.74]
PMVAMTSAALDKPIDVKATFPVDEMATEPKTNGVHDVLFDEADSDLSKSLVQPIDPKPTWNGDHPIIDTSGPIDGAAQFLPDSQTDVNSLFDGSELGATSVTNAVEAPTSDARDEPGPQTATTTQESNETTQHVPETQLEPKEEGSDQVKLPDDMDISQDESTLSSALSENAPPTKPMKELSLETDKVSASSLLPPTQSPTNADHEMEDAPTSGKVRSREDDDDDDIAPDAKRTKTEDTANPALFKVPELPLQPNGNGNGTTPSSADQSGVQSAVAYDNWLADPLTGPQYKFLAERIRNTKKIKVSQFFKDPVDILAYPTYTSFVPHPMDLSVMESKLREQTYDNIGHFMEDLDLIINNCVAFNGKEHAVTQAAYNMRAYFLKGMGKMPKGDGATAVAKPKPKKPSVSTQPSKARRESVQRVSAPPTAKSPTLPAPMAASPQTPWPLGTDGMPLIRRDSSSTNDRPKREIHRPPSKDLPYNTAKPKKKKYQQELKFCESVMSEIMKPKYAKFAFPFLSPVDPVALNIPTYLKIIKKPMDFGTIDKNLKAGQYQNAKDFHADASLVFSNCYKFNPEGDGVYMMGKQLNELFDSLWKEKTEWLAQHAPTSDPQSPEPAYSEDEEEEEEEVDRAQSQYLALQQQIAALNEAAQQLLQQRKRPSPKVAGKKKSTKPPPAPKRKGTLAVPPPVKPSKTKPRVKAPAPLTFAQKQEISDGISTLGDADMRRAVQIIRNGCPNLASVNDDEMEIDMDEINDDTLRELFKFIKQVRGPKGTVVDEDFEPTRASHKATAAKPKKNKPMGKREQEESIRKIEEALHAFQNSASGSSQSPPANHQDESSGDDDSGSESEEE